MRKKLLIGLLLTLSLPAEAFEVCWHNPSENIDGTALTDLVAVRVYYGDTARMYTQTVDFAETVPGAQVCHVVIPAEPGSYFVAATAIDRDGNESQYSNEVIKAEIRTEPLPPVIFLTSHVAYTVVKQPDRFVLVPIGTVPAGTQCDLNQSVNGYGVVPNSAVIWTSPTGARPIVVVAQCNG